MPLTRRALLALTATAALAKSHSLKFAVTDWNLKQTGQVAALATAKRIGFAGVQISLGRTPIDGHLPLTNRKTQLDYMSESQKLNFPIVSTCLDILHINYLKNDKLGQQWLREGIAATAALGVEVMLLPFFGKGAIESKDEQETVADILAEIGPEAEKSKVILGIENTIGADDNIRILERAKSKAVRVFYDTGNSAGKGFDVYREIRTLGSKRICQIHLKDNPHYLGDGPIDFAKVLRSINEAGFKQWAVLETESPSRTIEADMKKNLVYLQRLLKDTPPA